MINESTPRPPVPEEGMDLTGKEWSPEYWGQFYPMVSRLKEEIKTLRARAPSPAGPDALTWTREKPTKPGYYWSHVPAKNAMPPCVIHIDETPAGLVAYTTDGRSGLLAGTNPNTEWAGPIPEPRDPSQAPNIEGEAK